MKERLDDIKIKEILYKEAKKSIKYGDVPVGALILDSNLNLISKAHNEKEKHQNVLKHAEIIAINKANKKIKNWRLDNYSIYISLSPCLMCTGAIISSRIKRVVYYSESTNKEEYKLVKDIFFNNGIEFIYIENKKFSTLLSDFFKNKRKNK